LSCPTGEWDGRAMSTPDTPLLPRRAVIAAAAGLGAAAACGPAATPSTDATASVAPPPPTPTREPRPVAPADDIPVGGGRVYPDLRVVVTQPIPGEFRGFGIVCTHDSCELNAVKNGTINCPCHGSRYAITDGSVVRGPARTGLRTEKVAVQGDQVVLL
jgi:Rieske Fe-S protein